MSATRWNGTTRGVRSRGRKRRPDSWLPFLQPARVAKSWNSNLRDPFDVAEMKKNFTASPWQRDGSFIKSEPQSFSSDSNSLDFETEQDSSWRTPEHTGPIKSFEFPSMNDTLEHLRALCLQQAASDVQRACRQLCISSSMYVQLHFHLNSKLSSPGEESTRRFVSLTLTLRLRSLLSWEANLLEMRDVRLRVS